MLIIGGIAYLMIQGDDVKDRAKESAVMESTPPAPEEQPDPTPTEPQEAAPEPAGQYVQKDYDESLLATTENRKILFFHAPWCPQCRALEADILAKGVPPGVGAITDHVILAVGAPHKPVESSDRMKPVEYKEVVSEIGDMHCLICDVEVKIPEMLHEKNCPHCPCDKC